jgi:hypothetical protein
MTPERKRKNPDISSLIGWAIFILVIAGGPIVRGLQNFLGGGVQIGNLLPYLIGGLVLLSVVVSVVRGLAGRGERARLPDHGGPPVQPQPTMTQPMPPFGGELGLPQFPPAYRDLSSPRTRQESSALPRPPRFEPIVSPGLLVFGLFGALALGGAALFVFGLP